MTSYEAVIGLETHIQLNTNTKIFCTCKADSWGDPPNTNICPVCCGLPGVLSSSSDLIRAAAPSRLRRAVNCRASASSG